MSVRRDGGKKRFEVLANGLPQEHAYDVFYRHALALNHARDRLAFGSTTGSLWASEDQGGSWTYITQTLPTVYAPAFDRAGVAGVTTEASQIMRPRPQIKPACRAEALRGSLT